MKADWDKEKGAMSMRTPENLFNAYVEYSKIMFSNLFIINAGSAVALIAFLGNIKQESLGSTLVSPASAKNSIILFALGAFLAVLSTATTAILENKNSHILEEAMRTNKTLVPFKTGLGWFAFLLIICSGGAFMLACLFAMSVL